MKLYSGMRCKQEYSIKKLRKMKKNMGIADRLIRLIIAAIIAVLYFTDIVTGTFGIILLILAAIFLLTSMFGYCPLYCPLKMKTTPPETEE